MEQKSAFITILGRPNVGKSSLLNKLIGQKIAITSDKTQTTRTKITGILTKGADQFVFIDTPGFHKPHNLLGDSMIKAVQNGMADVDGAVLVIDAAPDFKFDKDNLPPAEISLIENLKSKKIPTVLVINKIDLLNEKDKLLEIISAYNSVYDFKSVVPLSAKTGDGIKILLNELKAFLKPSVHFFDDSDYTDQPDSVMVSEIIREKLLRLLSKEVPHGIAVGVDRFFESDMRNGEPLLNVEATVYCERESHKGIIIGKNGVMLKKVGTLSRQELEKFYGIKAVVKLWVKVKEDWRNKQNLIRSFGLEENN